MEYLINEKQLDKILNELSPKSSGVSEFLKKVEETPEVLTQLGFRSLKSLKDYISDGDYNDFEELKDDLEKFLNNPKKTKKKK